MEVRFEPVWCITIWDYTIQAGNKSMHIAYLSFIKLKIQNMYTVYKKISWPECSKDDSSSLTNEKDHHYFLNSADVCW